MKKNNDLQISKDEILKLINSLIEIHKLNQKENFESLKNYFSISSDLLLMFFLQEKLEKEVYSPLHSELEKIRRQIRETEEYDTLQKEFSNFKINSTTKNKGEHLLIEYLKI